MSTHTSSINVKAASERTKLLLVSGSRDDLLTNDILDTLSRDHCSRVRQRVAQHWMTPPEILERLALDPDKGTRYRVACNPATPLQTLLILMVDSDALVARSASRASTGRRVQTSSDRDRIES